jgi:hypothetical protein
VCLCMHIYVCACVSYTRAQMMKITEVCGMPPDHMLNNGRKVSNYFTRPSRDQPYQRVVTKKVCVDRTHTHTHTHTHTRAHVQNPTPHARLDEAHCPFTMHRSTRQSARASSRRCWARIRAARVDAARASQTTLRYLFLLIMHVWPLSGRSCVVSFLCSLSLASLLAGEPSHRRR